MLVPARRARRCFQSPLPAARAARRSRRRRQRLTILAPYNGEPWRIDGSVERARTPLAASTTNSQCTPRPHQRRGVCAEHTWTEDRQPPKTVVRHGGGLSDGRLTSQRYNSVCFCWKSSPSEGPFQKRGTYMDGIYVTSLRFVRTGVMKVMWILDRSEHSRLENMRFRVLPNVFQILAGQVFLYCEFTDYGCMMATFRNLYS